MGKMKNFDVRGNYESAGLDDEDFFWVGIDDGSGLVHE